VTTANIEVGGELTVSGNVVVDTNTLFVDSVNNRVGIGTGNPKTDGLNVTGSFVAQGVDSTIFSHNLYYNSGWKYASANNGGAYMRVVDSEIQFWNASNSGAEDAAATVSQRMTIDVDGNVGVGITSPDTALHVNGIIKQTGANWALTNAGVSTSANGGAHYDDFAYLNRTLSTPTGVTLTHVNQGGSNTRSRITINTAGKYAMYTNGFRQTGTSDTREIFIYKNGNYQYVRAYSGPNTTSNYATAGGAYTIMDLNANDYVEVYLEQATFHGNDSIYFVGHLIA
jgi:hypothetical protein